VEWLPLSDFNSTHWGDAKDRVALPFPARVIYALIELSSCVPAPAAHGFHSSVRLMRYPHYRDIDHSFDFRSENPSHSTNRTQTLDENAFCSNHQIL
jgi:hypothetical protein